MFVDGAGRQYLHPPGRPNDREKEIPWLESRGAEILSRDEGVERVVAARNDVTDRRRARQRDMEQRLQTQGRLTNRQLAGQRRRVASAERRATETAMKFGSRNVVVETSLPLKREDFDRVMDERTKFWEQELKDKKGDDLVSAMADIREGLLGDKFDRYSIFGLSESSKNKRFREQYLKADRTNIYSYINQAAVVSGRAAMGPKGLTRRYRDGKVTVKSTLDELKVGLVAGQKGKRAYFHPATIDKKSERHTAFINVGIYPPDKINETMFHEFAHYIEERNLRVRQAASHWRLSKAELGDDGKPKTFKLKERLPGQGYLDDEVAMEGDYWHPYVGKIYEGGRTEVLSMGLEWFNEPTRMAELYAEDPEHFSFVMSVLEGRWSFRLN